MNDDGNTANVSTDERWSRSPDVAQTRHGSSTFVLNLSSHSGQPIMLDGTAQDVWELVGDRTTQEIIQTLSSQYGVEATEIDLPVREFLAQLLELGLIRA